jgi:hypothetical protein
MKRQKLGNQSAAAPVCGNRSDTSTAHLLYFSDLADLHNIQ